MNSMQWAMAHYNDPWNPNDDAVVGLEEFGLGERDDTVDWDEVELDDLPWAPVRKTLTCVSADCMEDSDWIFPREEIQHPVEVMRVMPRQAGKNWSREHSPYVFCFECKQLVKRELAGDHMGRHRMEDLSWDEG